jgi:hypothetical protein
MSACCWMPEATSWCSADTTPISLRCFVAVCVVSEHRYKCGISGYFKKKEIYIGRGIPAG